MKPKRYKAIICEFMAFRTGHTFSTDTTFSQAALLDITPDDVCHWMNSRAFGEPDPDEAQSQ
ncbi:hypothetical protein PR003_g16884 [Phytophthora rubi]|uniref:Uncharacterized protein n=2 Tax=Phytophthora TaxID=4783 RepID=A0A6A4EKP5_9STRA|nr:hypothetical protein PR002_g28061 [Phytophthora rubi]KAE9017667.1 hypothetical protein PR001_g14338 [Phytophthora rubi]KAE9305991.1 hypothetical protein PF008_g21578 [Phytophthora fragariae]KAE9323840.1 hypothetical protein PR003_g16884 [Phytophthora rubi]